MDDASTQITQAVMDWDQLVQSGAEQEGPAQMWLVRVPGSGDESWHSVYTSEAGARYLEDYRGFELRTTEEQEAPVVLHMPQHRERGVQVQDDTYVGRHRTPAEIINLDNARTRM